MEKIKVDNKKSIRKNKLSFKKEIPRSKEPDIVVLPGSKERILYMLINILRGILKFLGKAMIRARQKRLAKRMDSKE